MKKILTLVLTVLMIASCISYTALAEDKVEISFKVGDSTLTINSTPVTVETPYVVGAGVTLVPVRVITEAFGAQVGWDAETQMVTIDYPEVKIILQIANSVAEVNGRTETLLAPPELSSNGYTMVPLRFISETFGAEVGYDDATKAVTVVKDNAGSSADTVVGAVDSDYIGDSFFGWTMENPKDAYMDERNFDGSYTSFVFDDESFIEIVFYAAEEDYDFEKDFNDAKQAYRGYTLSKAEKTELDNVKIITIHAKDNDSYMIEKVLVTDKHYINIYGQFANTAEMTETGIRIMDSFKPKFDSANAHDLSNVENGYRLFKDETIGIEINVPDDYYEYSGGTMNEFLFYRDDALDYSSQIHIGVFSKSEVAGAEELARKDWSHNTAYLNPSIFTFKEVSPVTYSGFSGYGYTYSSKGEEDYGSITDVFFENGDYVYNISLSYSNEIKDRQEETDAVLNSIKVGQADSDKLGIIMRNDPDTTGTHEVNGASWTLTLPNSFDAITANNEVFANYVNGTTLFVSAVPVSDKLKNAKEANVALVDEYKNANDGEVITRAVEKNINSRKWTFSEVKIKGDASTANALVYTIKENNKVYVLVFAVEEVSYSPLALEQINNIVGSFKSGK